jgi:hypothetical protein
MALTEITYTGDGSDVTFGPIPFPYLQNSDVLITINGTATTAFTIDNSTKIITFSSAPANGSTIRVYRNTNNDTLAATFVSGSAIRAADLNDNFTQNLYVIQEIDNNAIQTDGSKSMVGNLNMGGYKIANLATPTTDTDAVNRAYVNNIVANGIGDGDKGDITVSGSGSTLTIDNGVITNAKVNSGAGIVSSKLAFTQSGTGAVQRTVESKLQDVVSVKDFGALGNGTNDDTAAVQAAVNAIVTRGGGTVYFPFGTYLLNGTTGLDGIKHGIHVPYSSPGIQGASISVDLVGEGRDTVLKAGSASMYIIRYSSSLGCVRDLQILGDGTTLAGLALVGAHTTSDTGPADITHNSFTRLFVAYCVNGILLRCPAGAGSGVYYNNFSDLYIVYNQVAVSGQRGRGIYLQNGGPGCNNRNTFRDITFKRLNTGIEIQDGDTNTFYSCAFEDIGAASTLPNNPGASIIIGSGAGFISTAGNRFFGCTDEAVDRGVVNANSYSEFYGCSLGVKAGGSVNTYTAQPMTWLGGYDASFMPTIVPGLSRAAGTTNFSSFDVTALTAVTANIATALKVSRKSNPATSSASVNLDFGGTTSGTGPGGSAITHAYSHPYGSGAVYLVVGSAVSTTPGQGQMMRVSLFIEPASGTFIEQNIINYSATTTGSLALSRSGNDVNFTFSVATNNGTAASMNFNLIRIA